MGQAESVPTTEEVGETVVASPAMGPSDGCPYETLDEEVVFEGKWLRAKTMRIAKYCKADGRAQEETWEVVERLKRPGNPPVHGVYILPILRCSGEEASVVVVRQWRVAMGGWCVELCGGWMDGGECESAEELALRELREETGLEGVATAASTGASCEAAPVLLNTCRLVRVDIDGDEQVNRDAQPSLPQSELEVISVLRLPLPSLRKELEVLSETNYVQSELWCLTAGLELAATL